MENAFDEYFYSVLDTLNLNSYINSYKSFTEKLYDKGLSVDEASKEFDKEFHITEQKEIEAMYNEVAEEALLQHMV